MTDYAWGGYSNGQIPSAAMAIIPGTADFIKKELLPGVVGLRDAFRAQFGYTLSIVEAYRSLATQQYLYAGWVARKPGFNLAAYPGTSMHGWGLSIDFGSNVNTYGSAEKQWMDANAPRYGFTPTGNSFYPREAWHFDGTGTTSSGGNATPIPKGWLMALSDDEQADLYSKVNAIYNTIGQVHAGIFQETPTTRGTRGGVLTTLKAIDDALFKTDPSSFGTPGGTLKTLRAITDKLGITTP